MHDTYDELRLLRERMEDLERRLESRIQDDAGGSAALADVLRLIKFPLGGIGGGSTAYVDWLGGSSWNTGSSQLEVIYRGSASTTVGQGIDPRTGDRRTGYAGWNARASSWDVIQEFC